MKIGIIAGHGGKDSGAVDNKELEDGVYEDTLYSKESKIALKASKILNKLLGTHFNTVMVRKKQEYLSLYEKADIVNNKNVDIAISIHCNAVRNRNAQGIETLYYPTSDKGKTLANYIQNSLIQGSTANDRGIKPRDDLYILEKTKMPTVLVELGFLTNIREEILLNEDKYLDLLMRAIADGVRDYSEVIYDG